MNRKKLKAEDLTPIAELLRVDVINNDHYIHLDAPVDDAINNLEYVLEHRTMLQIDERTLKYALKILRQASSYELDIRTRKHHVEQALSWIEVMIEEIE